jgi:hypothetical protein
MTATFNHTGTPNPVCAYCGCEDHAWMSKFRYLGIDVDEIYEWTCDCGQKNLIDVHITVISKFTTHRKATP